MLLCPAEMCCQVVKPSWSWSCTRGLIGIIMPDKLPTPTIAQSGAASAVLGTSLSWDDVVATALRPLGGETPRPAPWPPWASWAPLSRATCPRWHCDTGAGRPGRCRGHGGQAALQPAPQGPAALFLACADFWHLFSPCSLHSEAEDDRRCRAVLTRRGWGRIRSGRCSELKRREEKLKITNRHNSAINKGD